MSNRAESKRQALIQKVGTGIAVSIAMASVAAVIVIAVLASKEIGKQAKPEDHEVIKTEEVYHEENEITQSGPKMDVEYGELERLMNEIAEKTRE